MPPVLSRAGRREWKRLAAEHAWLREELARLRAARRVDPHEHDALRARLAKHRDDVADWRQRHLAPRVVRPSA